MTTDESAVREVFPLGFPWPTLDPFLFCVYHQDFYPAGNPQLGPSASLAGRQLGQDFVVKDGWRMYHGTEVPGFPGHPHRGFETVTAVLQGCVDHADSLGASGRYADGDVQWMTAGKGVQHAEMFPLLSPESDNPLELFQIWLNLPRAKKMAEPHYRMLWREQIPVWHSADEAVEVRLIAGRIEQLQAPAPPPDSWAAAEDHEVAIWTIRLAPAARWQLPPASALAQRAVYFHAGDSLSLNQDVLEVQHGAVLHADRPVSLVNGQRESRLLLLQGRPIAEPVVQYGPFVMNTEAEIQQAFADYRRTRFGGWPWPHDAPVLERGQGRFATYADGRRETP